MPISGMHIQIDTTDQLSARERGRIDQTIECFQARRESARKDAAGILQKRKLRMQRQAGRKSEGKLREEWTDTATCSLA